MARRSKRSRNRGSHTHGSGSKKKRRGAGNRGGRGNAGTGKKGDGQKPSYWQDDRFGKHGFTPVNREQPETVNVSDLYKYGETEINLDKEGIDKLLGSGHVEQPYEVTVKHASKGAVNKIEEAGGTVTLLE